MNWIDAIVGGIAAVWMTVFIASNRWRGALTDKGVVQAYIAEDKAYGNLNMARMMSRNVFVLVDGEVYRLQQITFMGRRRNNR